MPASAPTAPRSLIVLALVALYLIWGSTYLATKIALGVWPPFLLSSMRYLVAGTVLYGAMRLSGAAAPSRQDWGRAAVVGLCLPVFGNGGTTFAQQYIPSGMTALLVASVPMYLALLGWASGLTPRPNAKVLLGLVLGIGGLLLLLKTDSTAPVLIPGHALLGIVAVLIGSFMWAVGSLYSREKPVSGSPFIGVGMQMLCGGFYLLLIGLLHGEASSFQVDNVPLKIWGALAYLVTFGSIIALSAYVWLLRVVEPALAGTYAFVNPVVALLLGWLFANETLNTGMLGGAALIVAAVALLVLGGKQPQPRKLA
ncbi:drug/metabolite exporter YedA [Hymenobacter lapidiphilus]|uniref:EamA family transporter n=1 Tax=Hymenobacter sp. CCM 8763 TaxID=2303334 RepID=UPI000E34D1A3|nr:EamA family transporter [Hymenobacter sp. CCM 8763]RFP66169.1 drug/metabolite exporter YedA [Hymenobacter sp. CCM 8763]